MTYKKTQKAFNIPAINNQLEALAAYLKIEDADNLISIKDVVDDIHYFGYGIDTYKVSHISKEMESDTIVVFNSSLWAIKLINPPEIELTVDTDAEFEYFSQTSERDFNTIMETLNRYPESDINLDEMVNSCFSDGATQIDNEATEINKKGIESQVRYLLKNGFNAGSITSVL